MTEAERFRALVDLNVRDLLRAYKLERASRFLGWAARVPAARFARDVIAFDRVVGDEGLVAAGRFVLDRFSGSLSLHGLDAVPLSGPILVVCNHPGMVDAMAVWVALGREDLKIIAADRDLLRLLPQIGRHLLLIEPGSSRVIRDATDHLKAGGALLTFPAGQIEPDPNLGDASPEVGTTWSAGYAAIARRAPGCRVVPAAVRGVVSATAVRNPLLGYLASPADRAWAAATLQIMVPSYRRVAVTVAFGRPLAAGDGLVVEVERAMRDLLAPPA
ncbi:MAG: 1-acyl-sn-glycerol-3-phosphate acyltransferase [Fimbriimonadaceae bacterium]|nr:1-acyl-sn-glycerol-3-phosphate acyltransferase [Fimbriimonadaceae bacterium]